MVILVPGGMKSQIREQMSGPDLHVFTLKRKFKKKGVMQLFSADAILVFSKN